jgi:hypothetical protein
MPFTPDQLKEIFTYHPPDAEQQLAYERLRVAAFDFSVVLVTLTHPCADQSAAIRLLRECVMTANAAIALHGKY